LKLLLDWSVLCHICWHRMNSPNYEARTNIEAAEFSRNIASTILELVTRFKPTELVFALDGKGYWRNSAYDKYYAEHCVFYKDVSKEESIYYMVHDMKYYVLKYYSDLGKFKQDKLNKAEKEEFHRQLGETITTVETSELSSDLKELIPTYKGNRKDSVWSYETSSKDAKILWSKCAYQLAETFEAKVIKVDMAEADDVGFVYAEDNVADNCIMVTTDSDWHQFLRKGLFLKFYRPDKCEFVAKTPETASTELAIKIMSGDASDNIAGIAFF